MSTFCRSVLLVEMEKRQCFQPIRRRVRSQSVAARGGQSVVAGRAAAPPRSQLPPAARRLKLEKGHDRTDLGWLGDVNFILN